MSADEECYAPIIQDLRWAALEEDMVGDVGEPDGMKDGNFQLTLNLPQPAVVTRISLYKSNETGDMAVQPSGTQIQAPVGPISAYFITVR